MNLSDIAIVFSIATSLVGGAGVGANYYAQHEFVTSESMLKRDMRDIRRDIRELEYDKEKRGLIEREKFILEGLKDELLDIQQELSN